MTIYVDAELHNADWSKNTWDLPNYKSDEFMEFLKSTGSNLTAFKKLPVYRRAVKSGIIKDDEWVG